MLCIAPGFLDYNVVLMVYYDYILLQQIDPD